MIFLIQDVPAQELIELMADDFKTRVEQPIFVFTVKTGSHKERAPNNPDWWHIRMASILRRIHIEGNIGTQSLRTYYGGKRNRGVRPHKFRKASGKVIRTCLQALEKEGLIKKFKKEGRMLTPKGQKYLNAKAKELKGSLQEIRKKKAVEKIQKMKEKDEILKERKKVKEQMREIRKMERTEKAKEAKSESKGKSKKSGGKKKPQKKTQKGGKGKKKK